MPLAQWLDQCRDDVTFAIRQLRSAPAFAAVAIATLALGIGANSAIFALVDATLLRPLPFPDADRLVILRERRDNAPPGRVAPGNMLDWNDRNRTFDLIAGFVPSVGGMVMAGRDGTAETASRQWVTQGYFAALGVNAIVGRTFSPSDDSTRANAVVLNETFWRSRFNADPAIVGSDIRLDGALYTVVGVVAKDAQLVGPTSIWALISLTPRQPAMRTAYNLQSVGRLKSGVTHEAASADLAAIANDLALEFPASNKGRTVVLEPMAEAVIGGDLRLTSILLLGVVGVVLLICCANVANLLLARSTVRMRELALRSALGAGRDRIVRQLVTESLVLSAIGGTLGMGVGWLILSVAPAMVPEGLLPQTVTLSFDGRVIAFCAAAAVFVGVLFAVAPAWHASASSPADALAAESRTMTGRGGRTRAVLVASEIATAVLLLFAAGLLLRTLIAVDTVDRGYRAQHVLTMMIDPLGSQYPNAESLQQFFRTVDEEVSAVPGVRHIAWTSALPMGPAERSRLSFEIVGDAPLDENQRPVTESQVVSPGYFQALDLPITSGRAFDERDHREATRVCIVNEAFARRYLQGRSPIGQRLALRPATAAQATPVVMEIVGVARQVKARPDETEELVQIYVPLVQNLLDDMYLVVRAATANAAALAPSVRAAIGRIDKEQLVSVRDVMTLDDVAGDTTSRHRFRALMVITFATLALLLAMVGVFGMFAYLVQQRMRDFAVRRALGATTSDVLRLVVSSALRVIVAGGLAGVALSVLAGRLLTTMLFGVEPLDPLTFAGVGIVLALTAGLSLAAPAWRATRIDPATVLRGQ